MTRRFERERTAQKAERERLAREAGTWGVYYVLSARQLDVLGRDTLGMGRTVAENLSLDAATARAKSEASRAGKTTVFRVYKASGGLVQEFRGEK